jgi:hypothetical protein
MGGDSYQGQATPLTSTNDFNALSFLVNQIANGNWTITLATVKAVHGGGVDGPPTVDVQPMVNQMNGSQQATPHGTVYGLPVLRLQAGDSGILLDPVAGDIGVMASASRDISAVVRTKKVSNPGSGRTFDPADSIYIGSLLGKQLKQFLQFTDTGLKVVDRNGNEIDMDANGITIKPKAGKPATVNGDVAITGNILLAGNIEGATSGSVYAGDLKTSGGIVAGQGTADQVTLLGHTHGYLKATGPTAPANSNAPNAGT